MIQVVIQAHASTTFVFYIDLLFPIGYLDNPSTYVSRIILCTVIELSLSVSLSVVGKLHFSHCTSSSSLIWRFITFSAMTFHNILCYDCFIIFSDMMFHNKGGLHTIQLSHRLGATRVLPRQQQRQGTYSVTAYTFVFVRVLTFT